jgi:L-rhamnose mutarotase
MNMKTVIAMGVMIVGVLFLAGCCSVCPGSPKTVVKRIQMVTGIKPDKIAYYKELHAHPWPSVNKKIQDCHIQNFSISLKQIGDKHYLFGYFEYVGADLDADMKRMAADPDTQRWWKETDPCQSPFPDAASKGKIWDDMEEVYFLK